MFAFGKIGVIQSNKIIILIKTIQCNVVVLVTSDTVLYVCNCACVCVCLVCTEEWTAVWLSHHHPSV